MLAVEDYGVTHWTHLAAVLAAHRVKLKKGSGGGGAKALLPAEAA